MVYMFELPVTGLLQPVPDSSSPQIQQIQNTYNVTVTFKQRPRMYATTVVVRGSVYNGKSVKEATALLIEHLAGNVGVCILVAVVFELPRIQSGWDTQLSDNFIYTYVNSFLCSVMLSQFNIKLVCTV